jgi:hypothetical protein
MFGLDDPSIWSAYLLCILSTLVCITYGFANWNKGDEQTYPEDMAWDEDEKKAEDQL